MVSQPIWIGIVIVVFFVGIGVSYAHFANTYDPMSMKFQNQGLFDQMMSNNPRMSQQWMDSGMMMVNQSWEFTFTDSGEYDYYCVLHPWMTGKIIVNESL